MRQSVIYYVISCGACEEKKDQQYSKSNAIKSYVAAGLFERLSQT